MQLFTMGGDLLSSSVSNVLPAFYSGLSSCQNLLLEGRQYKVDVDNIHRELLCDIVKYLVLLWRI